MATGPATNVSSAFCTLAHWNVTPGTTAKSITSAMAAEVGTWNVNRRILMDGLVAAEGASPFGEIEGSGVHDRQNPPSSVSG